jgi:hypothetical protein
MLQNPLRHDDETKQAAAEAEAALLRMCSVYQKACSDLHDAEYTKDILSSDGYHAFQTRDEADLLALSVEEEEEQQKQLLQPTAERNRNRNRNNNNNNGSSKRDARMNNRGRGGGGMQTTTARRHRCHRKSADDENDTLVKMATKLMLGGDS